MEPHNHSDDKSFSSNESQPPLKQRKLMFSSQESKDTSCAFSLPIVKFGKEILESNEMVCRAEKSEIFNDTVGCGISSKKYEFRYRQSLR